MRWPQGSCLGNDRPGGYVAGTRIRSNSTPSSAVIPAFATLRRNLLRCNVLAEDETYSENEGKAPWCEETVSESDGLQSACAGEDEAAPQAERLRETRESRSNSGHARC